MRIAPEARKANAKNGQCFSLLINQWSWRNCKHVFTFAEVSAQASRTTFPALQNLSYKFILYSGHFCSNFSIIFFCVLSFDALKVRSFGEQVVYSSALSAARVTPIKFLVASADCVAEKYLHDTSHVYNWIAISTTEIIAFRPFCLYLPKTKINFNDHKNNSNTGRILTPLPSLYLYPECAKSFQLRARSSFISKAAVFYLN